MTDREYDNLLKDAAKFGTQAGLNAAAWWEQDTIGGHATQHDRKCAELTLKGIEGGDPMIYDSLPFPNLSGEWTGDPTPTSVLDELDATDLLEPEEEQDVLDAWEIAAQDAVVAEVERLCREFLA